MQSRTELGANRTGMQVSPDSDDMLENIKLTKPRRGDERALAKVRAEYGEEADPVGTLPDPQEGAMAVLMDKLGERLAFERSGARLYDALLVKCETLGGAIPAKDVQHIRDEEATHFALLGAAIQSLGGDPTQQTPCADIAGVEGMGLMQVLTDPKTTLGQALHAILVAEMTDNAGWDELVMLTELSGNEDLVKRFAKARDEEQEHLEMVQRWYKEATAARMQE